ncbi:MAG: hypothetical protein SFY81_12320 [Verrucomicrobiota bacterium]|nr:hypothetical protein [Verrucomicrobiota bacterium]
MASGGDIVVWEDKVMRATQAGTKLIDKFKVDMVVRLPGKEVNTLIESKGVPWNLYGTSGWKGFIEQLQRQATAFSQATQTEKGVTIGERIISFSTKVPQGLEKAGRELKVLMQKHYNQVLFGEQELQNFLDGTP